MKTNLTEAQFEKLEKICLLLDILIDCEEYDELDNLTFDKMAQEFRTDSLHHIQRIENPTKEKISKGIEAIVKSGKVLKEIENLGNKMLTQR